MAPTVVRYLCMIFGLANIVGGIASGVQWGDTFPLLGGLLVGGGWFAFGWYGGLPLFDTVADWHPPASPDAVEDMHREGLRVMRRRQWTPWLAIPVLFAVAALIIPPLMRAGHPELVIFLLGPPYFFVTFRYYLSRCPRCGFGFFTRSASRAASLRQSDRCRHCGLSLYAYKESGA
jgi:hypothetical protein